MDNNYDYDDFPTESLSEIPSDTKNLHQSASWSLETAARAQRVQDIRIMLEQGDYRVPTRKLAPILARIFLAMNKPGNKNQEAILPD